MVSLIDSDAKSTYIPILQSVLSDDRAIQNTLPKQIHQLNHLRFKSSVFYFFWMNRIIEIESEVVNHPIQMEIHRRICIKLHESLDKQRGIFVIWWNLYISVSGRVSTQKVFASVLCITVRIGAAKSWIWKSSPAIHRTQRLTVKLSSIPIWHIWM